jgi:hypothetical protein
MNRRQFLAGAGTTVLGTAGGYGALRIADIRPYDPELPTGDSPRERIIAAAEHRHAADHRAITRVRVLDDWTGEAPYDLDVFRRWYQHSRRRQLRALTTYTAPMARSHPIREELSTDMFPYINILERAHSGRILGNTENLPLTTVHYFTDGKQVYDFDAPVPEDDTVRVSDAQATPLSLDYANESTRLDFIRPHRTNWTATDESAETVTHRVSGPDAYARVVPLRRTRELELDDCWIEVSLSRETGRLRQIVDHRDLKINVEEAAGQSLTFRIETEFDQYGDTTVRRPAGNIEQDLETRLNRLGYDLLTY